MASRQQVAFEPALAEMLAQHLHDAAVDAEIDVDVLDRCHPFLAGDFDDGFEPVRRGLVGADQPEVLFVEVELHDLAQEIAEDARRFRTDAAGLGHGHRVLVEVGHRQRLQQCTAIGVRIGAHATMTRRRERSELVAEFASFVEQFVRAVALHPVFELLGCSGSLKSAIGT